MSGQSEKVQKEIDSAGRKLIKKMDSCLKQYKTGVYKAFNQFESDAIRAVNKKRIKAKEKYIFFGGQSS